MPADAKTLPRTACWIALAYAIALAAPFLWGGIVDGDGGALIGALFVGTWTAAPIAAVACFVAGSSNRLGMILFLGFEIVLIASFGWVFIDSAYIHPSSTGGFVFITWPLVQWIAIVVVFFGATLFGWNMRPDFPEK